MELPHRIKTVLSLQHGMITSRQIFDCGISRTMTSIYVNAGLLVHVDRGVYVAPGGIVDDLLLLSLKVPSSVFSHGTSLFLNGLTDRTPFEPAITLRNDRVLTASLRNSVKSFYVAEELLEMGRIEKTTPLGNVVFAYDAERTICDIIRSRNRLDDELVVDGLRHYADYDKKNTALLGEYANRLGIVDVVRRTLEIVL